MAQQHLYSRVPARISLFNKTDGYDTFACSEGLSRQYIETELSKVYDNKPSKTDALLIQSGKLPPVYCQYVGKEKETVQSCVSFLTKDYTGERSSYLVHTLVLDENEQKDTMKHPTHSMLNPSLFLTDLDPETITSPDAPFGENYAPLPYSSPDAPAPSTLMEKYEPEMLYRDKKWAKKSL